MIRKFSSLLVVAWFVTAGVVARAQTLDQEMSKLADKLSKSLVAQGFKSVAALDFTDLQGQPTELGRFLSERLSVEIVSSAGVSMVDRANIKSILAEHKLTEAGLVDPANAKKLGEFAGVDAILTGNVTALDDGIELMVKAIATSSSKIVAAGRIRFPKTSEIQQLLNRGISGNSPGALSPASGTGDQAGTSYHSANAIATKDIGSLRVVLKSALPIKLSDGHAGVRCCFDFISLETQRPIAVAMNAIAPDVHYEHSIGSHLRSTLADENGGLWSLRNSDVAGISIVGVGKQSPLAGSFYDPAEIVTALSKRDELNADVTKGILPGSSLVFEYRFIFGSTTEMAAGQSVSVTMTFVQDENQTISGPPPKVFQIASEIVVGVATTGTKRSYALHNLTFDNVSMPAKK